VHFNRFFILLIFLTGISAIYPVYCQNNFIVNREDSISLLQLLKSAAKEEQIRLFYDSSQLAGIYVDPKKAGLTFSQIAGDELKKHGLGYISFPPGYLVIIKAPPETEQSGSDQVLLNKLENFQIEKSFNIAKSYTISGMVEDGKSSEPLLGATLYVKELGIGTMSNDAGYFSLTLPSGKYSILVSAVSFKKQEFSIPLLNDTTLDILLFNEITQLGEVVIHDEAEDHYVTDIAMGVTRLNIKELKHIPPLMGELDILKSILLLPGVTTVGEGSSGFNVRGGSADQNLILLDDAPIFNPSHLFGFFSAINSTAIKDVTLSRGGIPAQYGGRVSSILDIKTKQGNNKSIHGEGGIGLLASNLTLDGPLFSEKITYLASARISYSDWYLKLLPNTYLQNSSAYFHDAIVKITHRINPRNTLSITGYTSKDRFSFPGDTTYGWNTNNLTLSWSKYIRQKLFMTNEFVLSNYSYTVSGGEPASAFVWQAGINYYNLKGDLTYNINIKNKTDFGYSIGSYKLNLGTLDPQGDSSVLNPVKINPEQGMEYAVYINHEHIFNQKISLLAGLRYSHFYLTGPGEINQYIPGMPRNEANKTGTRVYANNEIIASYGGAEPRLSFKYGLDRNSSLKVSYNRTRQYIHLISNTSSISPVDIWKLSDPYLKPQVGDQVSLGYFRNLNSNIWETSAELYYKNVSNVIDYKDGADLVLNPSLETDLISGKLRSYGLELWIKKNKGRFTGSLSYTLSRTERKVNGSYPEEKINSGNYYPVPYDKLHDLSLSGNYQFTRRYSFAFNLIYNSGRPITYPVGSFIYFGFYVPDFELRNQERTPYYNRLDISFTIDGNHKKDNRLHGSWTFSVYNLFGRENPYSIFFKASGYRVPQAYKLSVIGVPVPSITYNFKFE
jgi:hypothetical protein